MVDEFEEVIYQKGTGSQKFHKSASLPQLRNWIIEAWSEMSNDVIQNSKDLFNFLLKY